MNHDPPSVIVLGGPNGAGKTTSSRALLAETLGVVTYVNADTIAQGLAGFAPATAALEAGRIMHRRLRDLAERKVDFAFETTLAARSYGPWLAELRRSGYHFLQLCYFWLASADIAVSRVAERVRSGGHDIPESTIRQRYPRSLRNLVKIYLPMADSWRIYNNTVDGESRLVASGRIDTAPAISDEDCWNEIFRSGCND